MQVAEPHQTPSSATGSAKAPRVSVIIPTYNRAPFLGQALGSILSQTLTPVEVLVVDDGSTDSTPLLVAQYSNVRYVRQDNGGKASAINSVLPNVTGDYVWIFDDDDVAVPDALFRLATTLERHPEHGFSYGTLYQTPSVGGVLGQPVGASEPPSNAATAPLVALLETCYLGGATMLARTECYRGVGGFDLRLRRSQDYDIALRIASRWSGIRVDGGPTYYYRIHSDPRGSGEHRVDFANIGKKHLAYDTILFRELCSCLPLSKFLPSEVELSDAHRQALLQRLSVLLIHGVYPEVLNDLESFSQPVEHAASYTPEEIDVLARMVDYTNGLAGVPAFLSRVAELAKAHNTIRVLRKNLTTLMIARAKRQQSHVQAAKLIWRTSWMYASGQGLLALKRRVAL